MRCMCRHVTCRIDMLHMTFYGMLHTAMYSTDIVHTNMCKQVTHKNLQECRSTCSTYWHVHIYRHVTHGHVRACYIPYWHVQASYHPDICEHATYWYVQAYYVLTCADMLHIDISRHVQTCCILISMCRHIAYWHLQTCNILTCAETYVLLYKLSTFITGEKIWSIKSVDH